MEGGGGRAEKIGSPLSHSLRANFRAKAKKGGGGKEIDGGGGARVLFFPRGRLEVGGIRYIGLDLA